MKHTFSSMMIALALALVLAMGIAALAENTESATPQLPAAGDLQQAPADAPAEAPDAAQSQDNTALQQAMDAYRKARQSAHEQNLQDELNGYVAAGTLTQEQADLIMNYYKEQQSMRDGTCPSCGYQFQNGKGGRMGGGKGNRGGQNGFGRGNQGGFGRGGMGGFGREFGQGSASGMSVQPEMQPQLPGGEGI